MRPSSPPGIWRNSLVRRISAVSRRCRARSRSRRTGPGYVLGAARDPHTPLQRTAIGVCAMNRLLVKLAITAAAGSLLCSSPIGAQNPPPQKRAEHVEILKGPGLEVSHDDLAIIRWTSTNPAGDDDHWA